MVPGANNDAHASHHESETTFCMYHTAQHHADPGWGDFALRHICALFVTWLAKRPMADKTVPSTRHAELS